MSILHRGNKAITLFVTCLGSFMVLLDASIVTVALPTIQASLHTQLSDLQWAVDAYTLPFAALLLTVGALSDRFGRKRLFLGGMALFLLGSAFCGFAPTFGWFLIGRAVQGIGGAALSSSSLSVLVTAFSDPRERSQAIGIWSGISGIALAIGPLAGGLLIQVAHWPSIFLVNLPIGVLAIALGLPTLAESRNPNARRIDIPGQLLVIAGLTCLIIGLIEGGSLGWFSPVILGLFLGAVVFLLGFGFLETWVREPLLPLPLFKNRVFSGANVGGMVLSFAILGTVFFMTQYFQVIQAYTAPETGLLMLPLTMGTFLTAPLAGRITAYTTPRLPIVLGALLASAALFGLSNLAPVSSYASLWWKLGLFGVGIGLMMSPLTVAVLSTSSADRSGLASSIVSTSRQIGSTLGVAVLGAFVIHQFSANIASLLSQHGLSSSASTTIANKLATSGAQASNVSLLRHLSLSPAALHQGMNLAFVNALHGSFLISSIALLAVAVLVALTFPPKERTTSIPTAAVAGQKTNALPVLAATVEVSM